jgi:hypothetical protein
MKRLVFFDVYDVDTYELTSRLAELRRRPGVRSAVLLVAAEGSPRYCLELETDDDQDATIWQSIRAEMAQYPEHVSNISSRVFRVVA